MMQPEEWATTVAGRVVPISLPAMSSYERKLIHDIVAERGLVSESYGEGADRHTVIRRG